MAMPRPSRPTPPIARLGAARGSCNREKKGLDKDCLKSDFVKKLTDKVEAEISRLDSCASQHWEDVASCLGLGGLEQSKLYAIMEEQTFVWRSMYVDHLQRWLKVYPPESMLIVPSESLKEVRGLGMTPKRTLGMTPNEPPMSP